MNTKIIQSTMLEIFADAGKMLDLGNGEFTEYICAPANFNVNTIKEVDIENIDELTLLEKTRTEMIDKISKYDISPSVNSFYIDNMTMWIPRETRVSLRNSTNILIDKGITTTTLWDGVLHFEISCELLLQLLGDLEVYALQCFNKTAEHKANIMKLTSIEEIENYNYTEGYPEKLTFSLL